MWISESEKPLLTAIGNLNFTNPFTPERLELEKTILGPACRSYGRVWNMHSATASAQSNVERIKEISEQTACRLRKRLDCPTVLPTEEERDLYEPVVLYHLFEKYRGAMSERMLADPEETAYPVYRKFLEDYHYFMNRPGRTLPSIYTPEKTFAMYFQIHRAFYHIFDFIAGSTLEAGALRAAIWQSIFSSDIRRYHRVLYRRMNSITTLITGESGTGKELVARAIALSGYIPFHAENCRFEAAYPACFKPVQLSAMPQTMLESELFGHRKGAYTGALSDRTGYLEECPFCGSVFLDEIGEINAETQVKLLRVLQTRRFQRLGDSSERAFQGKVIAATNRDLHQACAEGAFRSDLYYRLCADTVTTVPLRNLIHGESGELLHFVRTLSERILGREESELFAPEAVQWICDHLGAEYPWPGNVRELEQCVRNLIIRGSYRPAELPGKEKLLETLLGNCGLTAEELLTRYLTVLYAQEKSYVRTAERAGLDRRTVRARLTRQA